MTHKERLRWLAGRERECPHTNTEWQPTRDEPGCEDGKWVCLNCGAEKNREYRPLLEAWKGGTGKVARFPTLRKECLQCKGKQGQNVAGCADKYCTCMMWEPCGGCQGRGYTPSDSLEAIAKSAYEFMRDQTNAHLFSQYMWACARGDNEAVVLAFYEAMQKEKPCG